MAWTLIKSNEEYQDYCGKIAASYGYDPDHSWAVVPKELPCLADIVRLHGTIKFAYVYLSDAKELLVAAGFKFLSDEAASEPAASAAPTQGDFNNHVAAQLVTLLNIMIEKDLVTEEAYERKLTANLAMVERYAVSDRAKIIKAVPGAGTVLDNLLGMKPEEPA